jgi:hypothetical protein
MNIGIVFVHDKGAGGNTAQVAVLEGRLTLIDGNAYSISGVADHVFYLYEIVPQGVTPPSHSLHPVRRVIYGNDRPGTTGNFFNWGMSRAIGHESLDAMIYMETPASLSAANINNSLTNLTDLLEDEPYGKMLTKSWFNAIKGSLDDTKTIGQAISAYKAQTGGLNGKAVE